MGEQQVVKLARLRHERNGAHVRDSLRALRAAAEGEANLMPLILDAIEAYATLGEICDVLRDAYGEYRPAFKL